MAGPPHNFSGNFASAQSASHGMRSQFGGGPQMNNMMGGVSQGMVSPQPYGMNAAVPPSLPGMQQQSMQQQSMQQQSMQQQSMQQQSMQQQSAQMAAQMQQVKVGGGVPSQGQQVQPAVGQTGSGQVQGPGGGQVQVQAQPTVPAPPQNKEINTAALCRYGQEVVQEIVSRITEVFALLKTLQPPIGTPQGANACNERKVKIQELLLNIRNLFKRLGMIYQRCNDSGQVQGMEYMHIESLIPLKEEWDQKADEKKMSESYRMACEERREIMEQVLLKNKHLKEVIDSMRRIVWEVNSMLCMRRS